MKNSIKTITEIIVKESKLFLESDVALDVTSIKNIQKIDIKDQIASLSLYADKKYLVSMVLDDMLFKKLFKNFFSEIEVCEDERVELEEALPDEVINQIVGLSIRNFPSEYNDLKLSIPKKLQKTELQGILNKNASYSMKLVTSYGNMIVTTSLLK